MTVTLPGDPELLAVALDAGAADADAVVVVHLQLLFCCPSIQSNGTSVFQLSSRALLFFLNLSVLAVFALAKSLLRWKQYRQSP